MSKQADTIAYNLAAIAKMRAEQAKAAVTGGTCPKCGGGANPVLVDLWGHCLACQNATIGR